MRKPLILRLLTAVWIIMVLFPISIGKAEPRQQSDSPQISAQEILDQMSPQERVGQLFLVK